MKKTISFLLTMFVLLATNLAAIAQADDKINISSKYGYVASKQWFYSALFSFKTQFFSGL